MAKWKSTLEEYVMIVVLMQIIVSLNIAIELSHSGVLPLKLEQTLHSVIAGFSMQASTIQNTFRLVVAATK